MAITSTQTTELSLDQLDDISAGFGVFKAAVKTMRTVAVVGKKIGNNSLPVVPDLAEEAGIPVSAISSISRGPTGWMYLATFTHDGGWQESANKARNTANKARNLFGRVFG